MDIYFDVTQDGEFYKVIKNDIVIFKSTKLIRAAFTMLQEKLKDTNADIYLEQPNIIPKISGLDLQQIESLIAENQDMLKEIQRLRSLLELYEGDDPNQADVTPPTAPTGLFTTNLVYNQFTLNWAASTDNIGVQSYQIFKDAQYIDQVGGGETDYRVTGLTAETSYDFYVLAKDAAGNSSANSSTLNVTTPAQPDTENPTAATLALDSKTDTTIDVSWSGATDNVGVTSYDVYLDFGFIANTANSPYQYTGLTANTNYDLTVVAKDAAGNVSPASNVVNVTTDTTADTTNPTAATLVLSDIGSTFANFTWSGATDNVAVTSYDFYVNDVLDGSTSNEFYSVTDLTPSTAYDFHVISRDAAGNSSVESNTITDTTPAVEVLAFPSAVGAGANVTGGRGKPVYKVTNLNASGAGSFVQALNDTKTTTGGIIVFEVSGTVVLTSSTVITDVTNVTIGGQSAPAGGIDIAGNKMKWVGFDNVIVRYVRFRPPYNAAGNIPDAFQNFDCSNMIYDHCSFSWGQDECFSFTAPQAGDRCDNITVQRCLFADSKTAMLLGDSNDASKNSNLSFINNLTYNITHRFPNISTNGAAEIINNLFYNFKFRLSVTVGSPQLNYIGNYIDAANHTINNSTVNMLIVNESVAGYFPLVYATDNIAAYNGATTGGFLNAGEDNWKIFRNRDISDPYDDEGNPISEGTYRTGTQHTLLGKAVTLQSALDARNDILADVGCNARLDDTAGTIENKDSLDTMYIDNIVNNTPHTYSSNGQSQDYMSDTWYIDYQAAVSTTPLATRSDYSTTDNIPTNWKIAKGFLDTNDLTSHVWPSGYIGIEEYLNSTFVAPPGNVPAESVAVVPATASIAVSQTVQLSASFTPINTTDKSGVWVTDNGAIATVNTTGLVTGAGVGSATITFTSNDGGFQDTCVVTVSALTNLYTENDAASPTGETNTVGGNWIPNYESTDVSIASVAGGNGTSYSLEFSSSSQGWNRAGFVITGLSAGNTYNITADIRTTDGAAGGGSGFVLLSAGTNLGGAGTTWTNKSSGNFTGVTTVTMRVYTMDGDTGAASHKIYMDNIIIEQV